MYAACIVYENYRHARKSHHKYNLHATNYCVLHASYLRMCKTHVCYTRKLHMCMLLQCYMCALLERLQDFCGVYVALNLKIDQTIKSVFNLQHLVVLPKYPCT